MDRRHPLKINDFRHRSIIADSSPLTAADHPVSVGVEQLEGRLVEGVREAEQPFERLELRIRDEAILARVDDGREQPDRLLVVVLRPEETQIGDDEVLRGHEPLAVLLHRGILGEDRPQGVRVRPLQVAAALQRDAG